MVWWDAGRLVDSPCLLPNAAHRGVCLCLLADRTRRSKATGDCACFFDYVCCSASYVPFDHLGITCYTRLKLETSKCQHTHPRYFQIACCFRWLTLFYSCGERSTHAGLVQPPFPCSFLCTL